MCAMNRINGTYACENQGLFAKHLKVELGFPGIVHPDAGVQHDGFQSANAGQDFESSSYWSNYTPGEALANGAFTQERLDYMAIGISWAFIGMRRMIAILIMCRLRICECAW